jgi:hypothetical protein
MQKGKYLQKLGGIPHLARLRLPRLSKLLPIHLISDDHFSPALQSFCLRLHLSMTLVTVLGRGVSAGIQKLSTYLAAGLGAKKLRLYAGPSNLGETRQPSLGF